MGSLITLAIYGALAAGAFLAIHSFLGSYEAKGAKAQLEVDTPIINACKTDRDTAVKANVSLQSDLAKLAGEREQQNAAIAAQAAEQTRLEAAKAKALAEAQARLAALGRDNASLASILAAAPKGGQTCEQTLAAVDDNLRSAARQRVRFSPPEAGNSSGGANRAPDQNPGADPVRIHP